MEHRIAALIFAGLFATGSALASGMEHSQKKDFQALDTNGDGVISQQEADANPELASNWQQADKNADGQVDMSEFSAFETTMEDTSESGD